MIKKEQGSKRSKIEEFFMGRKGAPTPSPALIIGVLALAGYLIFRK